MPFLLFLLALTVMVAVYVVWVRPWLRAKPWAAGFFAAIEPIELALWRKSETILWARFKVVVGLVLTALTQIGQIDLTPLLPFVPEKHQTFVLVSIGCLPLLISAVGWIDEQLRKDTTKPLDVVALPAVVPSPVADAVAVAEVANAQAVAAAKAVQG